MILKMRFFNLRFEEDDVFLSICKVYNWQQNCEYDNKITVFLSYPLKMQVWIWQYNCVYDIKSLCL